MDPPPSSSSAALKLRLLCSYGGRIVPRPQTKSLYYSGGENRLVTIPTTTDNTFSSLTTHLSAFLHLTTPFFLKYQLPNHDLDSLISISNDDDLQIMLEEHKRVSSSSTTPSRIRLFIFPVGNVDKAELTHPKRESWFVDALRSARVGFGGETIGEQAESIYLETSSFGSTSSNPSLSSLPPIKPSPDSKPSDEYIGSAVCNVQTGTFQDQVGHIGSNLFESDKRFADPTSAIEMHKPIHAGGFPVNLMHFPQQQAQVIHEDTRYVPPNMAGTQPVTSYYPVYYPVPQQQHLHYQSNQPYSISYVPIVPAQSYNVPVQHGMVQANNVHVQHGMVQANNIPVQHGMAQANNIPVEHGMVQATEIGSGHPHGMVQANNIHVEHGMVQANNIPVQHGMVQATEIGSGHPQALQNASLIQSQMLQAAELTSQQYQQIPGHQLISVPHTETETRFAGAQIQQQQPESLGETANYTNKLDDDPSRVQIYKSQPPPPILPSQYQTMTKATTLLLSEALAKLHTDNAEQPITTPEPK